jgi:hypothetical protein
MVPLYRRKFLFFYFYLVEFRITLLDTLRSLSGLDYLVDIPGIEYILNY